MMFSRLEDDEAVGVPQLGYEFVVMSGRRLESLYNSTFVPPAGCRAGRSRSNHPAAPAEDGHYHGKALRNLQ
jgi:hypothetical protein